MWPIRQLPTGRYTFGLGLLIVGALWAMSRSRVVVDARRVTVVNGFRTRVFEREEVLGVALPQGAPWATVDLADGTSVPAMGVQGSDGDRAKTAVREFRRVLAARTRTDRND
jgi:hypothetical protein